MATLVIDFHCKQYKVAPLGESVLVRIMRAELNNQQRDKG